MYKGVYFIFATLPYFNGGIPVPRALQTARTRIHGATRVLHRECPRKHSSVYVYSARVRVYMCVIYACVCIPKSVCPRARPRIKMTGSGGRRPGAPFFSLRLCSSLPSPASPRNHSHVQRLQKCSATFPRERADPLTDRPSVHNTPTRYPFSRLERGTLNGCGDVAWVSPVGELEFRNRSTERMKLQPSSR